MPPPILAVVDLTDEIATRTVHTGGGLARAQGTTLVIVGCEKKGTGGPVRSEETLRRAAQSVPSTDVLWFGAQCENLIECIRSAVLDHGPAWVCVSRSVLNETERHALGAPPIERLVATVASPLWVVASPGTRRSVVLAAIDPSHEHDKPARLDELILQYAAWIAELRSAELHVLHAVFEFDIPETVLDELRGRWHETVLQLVQPYDVPSSQVHVPIGLESQTIERHAEDLNADIVVMGAVRRSMWRRMLVGSTTREVVPKLHCDIVTLMPDAPILK